MGSNPGGTRVNATVLFDTKISNEEFRKHTRLGEFAATAPPPPVIPPDEMNPLSLKGAEVRARRGMYAHRRQFWS